MNILKKINLKSPTFILSIVLLLIFVLSVVFMLPNNSSSTDNIVKNFSLTQLPSTPGQSIKWIKTIKVSEINNNQHLLEIPKVASNVKLSTSTINKVSSTKSSTITTADRKKLSKIAAERSQSTSALALAESIKKQSAEANQKLGFFGKIFQFFSKIASHMFATVEDAVATPPEPDTTVVDVAPIVTSTETPASTETVSTPSETNPTEVSTSSEVAPVTPATSSEEISTSSESTSSVEVVASTSSTSESSSSVESTSSQTSTSSEQVATSTASSTISSTASSTDLVKVEYETPAPVISEADTDTGKIVTVSASDTPDAPVTNVLAFTNIPKIYKVGQEDKIHIKWVNNGDQNVVFKAYDLNKDGWLDYVEWTVPHLSTQTFEIIFISKAFELDIDQSILADIYDTVKTKDSNYATINDGQYVRTTFNSVLSNNNDITIYARPSVITKPASIEVYPVYADADGNQTEGDKLTLANDNINPNFDHINHDGKYRILLSNLQTPTDVFDLKFTGNADVDYIVDPAGCVTSPDNASYTLCTYTSSGTFTPPINVSSVQAVVVGGGGAGGGGGGGGGAGGYQYNAAYPVTSGQTYTVTVGSGGVSVIGNNSSHKGTNGSNSVFDGIIAIGGGAGGFINDPSGNDGGSGGGGAGINGSRGIGSQGNNGGTGLGYVHTGGGGGGAGGIGQNGTEIAGGNGGVGVVNPIVGSTAGQNVGGIYYLAGGGGGRGSTGTAVGGYGGGGASPRDVGGVPAVAGTANTGGGGGGGSDPDGHGTWYPANGGSGVVIIKYLHPKYYVGTNGSWNTASNWASNSGGTDSIGVPIAGDIAIFDAGGSGNVNIDSGLTVSSIQINSNFTRTITKTSNQIINASSFVQNGGTFVSGSGGVQIDGPFTLSSGTFTASSGTIRTGEWTNSGGTFVGGSGEVIISGPFTLSSGSFTAPSTNMSVLGNWTNSGGTFVGGSGQVTIEGSFNLSSGTFTATSGNMNVAGNWINSGGTFINNGGKVTFIGGGQSILGENTFFNLTDNASYSISALSFDSSVTTTITNDLILNGLSFGNPLSIGGNNGSFNILQTGSGTTSLSYLHVTNSTNLSASPFYCANCIDGGGNTNWQYSSNVSGLDTAILTAQGLIDASSTESTNAGDHIIGSLATLQAVFDATTATSTSPQNIVDAQTTALNAAIDLYNASIVVVSDTTALGVATSTAQGLIDANGPESDIPGQHTVGALDALRTALGAITATSTSPQSVVDDQTTTLNAAIDTYNNAIVPPSYIDWLNGSRQNAQYLLDTNCNSEDQPTCYPGYSFGGLSGVLSQYGAVDNTYAQGDVDAAASAIDAAGYYFFSSSFQIPYSDTSNYDMFKSWSLSACYDTCGQQGTHYCADRDAVCYAGQTIYTDGSYPQSQVDAAGNALSDAFGAYWNSPTIPYTDTSVLDAYRATADGLISANAPEGEDNGDHVVGSLDALIYARSLATADWSYSQGDVDAQSAALGAAIDAYNAAIVTGPDISGLDALRTTAQGLISAAAPESDAVSYHYPGSLDALSTALSLATGTNSDTPQVVSAQKSALSRAISAYNSSTLTQFISTISDNINISSTQVSYGIDDYTKLMLHMDGNFTDSSPSSHTVTTVGNTAISTTQSEFGGASGLFNGSSYLSIPASDDFNFGTGDFTIDMWINTTSQGSYDRFIAGGTDENGANQQWFFGKWPGATFDFGYKNSGGGYTETTYNVGTWNNGTWYHVALTRQGANVYFFWNGTLVGTWNMGSSVAINTGAAGITVGARYYGGPATEYFNGYIDELRVSKGVARWTSNFTPPPAPYSGNTNPNNSDILTQNSYVNNLSLLSGGYLSLADHTLNVAGDWTNSGGTFVSNGGTVNMVGTNQNIVGENTFENLTKNTLASTSLSFDSSATTTITGNLVLNGSASHLLTIKPYIDDYTKLMLHMDGNFTDSSPSSHTVTTVGNTAISTTQSEFGGASGLFNGSSDYLTIPASDDFNFGSGDFTIDGWFYFNVASTHILLGYYDSAHEGQNGWTLFTENGQLSFLSAGSSGWNNWVLYHSSFVPTTQTWTHIALVRNGNTFTLYANGQNVMSGTFTGSIGDYSGPLSIGARNDGTALFSGYIDELRISKGIARWTSNFTPPTSFYSDAGPSFNIKQTSGTTSLSYLYVASSTNLSASPFVCSNCVDGGNNTNWLFPALHSISILPLSPNVIVGATTTLYSIKLDQYGSLFSETTTWASSRPSVGTINSSGLFTASLVGTTTITATAGGISTSTIATVLRVPPTLYSISILPLNPSVTVGKTTSFSATTLDQYGAQISAIVTWSSSPTSVGTINSSGLFTGKGAGTATVTATADNFSTTTTVTVSVIPHKSTNQDINGVGGDTTDGTSTSLIEDIGNTISNILNPQPKVLTPIKTVEIPVTVPEAFKLPDIPTFSGTGKNSFSLITPISTFVFAPLPDAIKNILGKSEGLTSYLAAAGVSKPQDFVALGRNPILVSGSSSPSDLFTVSTGTTTIRTYITTDLDNKIIQLVRVASGTPLTISFTPANANPVKGTWNNNIISIPLYKKQAVFKLVSPSAPGKYYLTTTSSPLPLVIEVLDIKPVAKPASLWSVILGWFGR